MAKRKVPAPPRADGPSSLSELLRLPEQFVTIFGHPDHSANFASLCKDGLVVTSNFSGTGGFEGAAEALLTSAIAEAGQAGEVPAIVFYSASDSSESARRALMLHTPKTKSKHIFGDIIERVPPRTRSELIAVEKTYLDMWSSLKQEHALGGLPKSALVTQCDKLGEEYVCQVLQILADTEFLPEVHCYVHDKPCPVSPRHAEQVLGFERLRLNYTGLPTRRLRAAVDRVHCLRTILGGPDQFSWFP
jgi:hypothetical protein